MVIFETDRLILRKPTVADAEFMLRLVNEPSWLQYIGDRNVHSLEDAENYLLNGSIKSFHERGYGFGIVMLKGSNTPIGMCGFAKRDYLEDVDIGFAFFPEYTGQGYAFEVASTCMEYGRSTFRFNRVVAITTQNNESSIRLLKKLGMELEKTVMVDGEELNLFSISFDAK
jgi:RimJ/RimL family protein N-acetyltransferase